MSADDAERGSLIAGAWAHPWGRVLLVALTIAAVSWAIRETASITLPVVEALGAVLMPVLVGFTIAYVLTPVVDAISRHGTTRLVATAVLFAVGAAVTALAVGLGAPALIAQSAQLASRTVQDQAYLDVDGDGRLGPRDRVLVADPAEPRRYVETLAADGSAPAGPAWYQGRDAVRIEPSIAGQVLAWLDEQQGRVERSFGGELDARSQLLIEVHRRRTALVRQVLDAGLAQAENGLPATQWPPSLRIDPNDLPSFSGAWHRAWPGVSTERYEAAAAALPDDATRVQWRAIMNRYGLAFAQQQERLLAAWELVLTGREAEAPPPAPAPPSTAFSPDLPEAERERLATALAEALAARTAPVRDLLDEVGRQPGELARDLRALLDAGAAPAEPEALATYHQHLRAGDAAGAAWAGALFRALRPQRNETGVLDLALDHLGREARSRLTRSSQDLAASVGDSLTPGAVLAWSLDLLLIPIYAFFLILAMPAIRRTVRRYLPGSHKEVLIRILHDIERVVAAFFRGRLVICIVCGALTTIGFVICGVPYAVLFGVLIGLATTVPLSGLLFLVPAVLLVLLDGGPDAMWWAVGVVAVYTVIQTLEMAVLTPLIMGREVELHPVVLILALLLCGKLLGVIGLILAVPIAATVRILARQFLLPRLRKFADLPVHTAMIRKPDA